MMHGSRRQVLAAAGASLTTALAGCGGLDGSVFDDDPESYDRNALADLTGRSPPVPPTAFPVSIPSTAFARHRSRIRTLLDEVPSSPTLPNGALSAELAERRSEVASRFRNLIRNETGRSPDTESEVHSETTNPRDRLDGLRSLRADAAAVHAAYLAATGRVERETFRSRRETLRSRRFAFVRSWTYDGASPLEALIFHGHIEGLVERVRSSLRDRTSFPSRPRDAVFDVGSVAESLEHAQAALADAKLLRRAYRRSRSDTTTYRDTIERTAERLTGEYEITAAHADVHEYVELEDPPFDRSIEGTPAGTLYQRAIERLDEERIERRGPGFQPASRSLDAAVGLASIETFRTVVERIKAGNYPTPNSTEPLITAHDDALNALRMAWDGTPQSLSLHLAKPATEAFNSALRRLQQTIEDEPDSDLSKHVISEVYGKFLFTYHYATYVPPATDHVLTVLQNADR